MSIMLSFSKKVEKLCDANFLSVFYKNYLGENNISLIDINGYKIFPKNPKSLYMRKLPPYYKQQKRLFQTLIDSKTHKKHERIYKDTKIPRIGLCLWKILQTLFGLMAA